ncbi:hypothetical protein JCM4914_34010 [Streptomyces platensis subsp. malvinus]
MGCRKGCAMGSREGRVVGSREGRVVGLVEQPYLLGPVRRLEAAACFGDRCGYRPSESRTW